ncbi:MAG: hypothetical protein AAB392_02485 [Patescibacteria group bacterium]
MESINRPDIEKAENGVENEPTRNEKMRAAQMRVVEMFKQRWLETKI